jgi:kinesin family protein C1
MGVTKSPNYTSFSDLSKQTIELTEPQRDRGGLNPRRKKWKYGFDKVFNPVNDQADVWEGAEPLVQSAVDGHKVCMFAYGQTSSGKTHTMIGDSVNRGIIPRAVEKLFASKKEIEQSFQGDVSVSIKVELLEIYNEEVYDLLNAEAGPKGQKIKIKLNSNEAVNNAVVEASTQDEVQGVLQLAQQRRCVKATKSNAESSRSHLLFTVRFELSSLINEEMNRQGVLHIVDLAGSERLDKSGSQGTLLTEAKHINTSLSALSHVIQKLQEKSDHIPYRDSKLTYLLRDSLGGDSKTLCIVCCSPHQAHFNESLNSIRFAANASKVELKQGNKVDV